MVREQRYSSTHSLTSALHVGGWSALLPALFTLCASNTDGKRCYVYVWIGYYYGS